MNKYMRDVVSRPLGVAEALLKTRIDPAAVYGKHVILTGEEPTLATQNGRWCFLDALMLLSRVAGHLTVSVPAAANNLHDQVVRSCSRAWFLGSIKIVRGVACETLESTDAILNVGTEVRPWLPWTSINSNGWVARVSSGSKPLPPESTQANPLGALMAASFGATEVFKRIFSVPTDIAPPLDCCEFSLFELTTTPTGPGPVLLRAVSKFDGAMFTIDDGRAA